MRIVRNLVILSLLIAAPLVAQQSFVIKPASTCGACTCDAGQCCSKGILGGCECTICKPPDI